MLLLFKGIFVKGIYQFHIGRIIYNVIYNSGLNLFADRTNTLSHPVISPTTSHLKPSPSYIVI